MNIRKIALNNINSLKGSHIVDFTIPPLSNSTLFAITGPTGSGKTTLLDAICLALYNRIPRIKSSISKNLIETAGVILARNTKSCHVHVEFECNKGIYSSRWEITTNRNGALRDYEMRLYDNFGNVVEEKKANVLTRIEQLIGLNYDQFVKSVMLPQGDFALFLKSSKHERGQLLEKITGSSIYRIIGQLAFQKAKEIEGTIKQLEIRINELKLQKNDNDTYAAQQSNKVSLELKLNECEQQIIRTTQIIDIKQNIKQVEANAKNTKNQLVEHQKKADEFETSYGDMLLKHQQLSTYIETINHISAITKQIEKAIEKQQYINRQIIKNNLQIKNIVEYINIFIQKGEKRSNNPIDNLEHFYITIKELETLAIQKQTEYKAVFEPLKQIAEDIGLEIYPREEPQVIATKISDTRQTIRTIIEELEQHNPRLSIKQETRLIDELYTTQETIIEWEKIDILLKHKLQNFSELEQLQKQNQAEIDTIKKNIQTRVVEYETICSKYESKRKDLIINQLETKINTLRQSLENGGPCPVCGSTQHPWANKAAVTAPNIENEVIELEKTKDTIKSLIDSEKGKIEQNHKQVVDRTNYLDDIQSDIDKLKHQIEQLIAAQYQYTKSNNLTAAKAIIKKQISDYQEYIKLNASLDKINKSRLYISQLREIFETGKEIRQKIKTLYSGNRFDDEYNDLKNSYLNITNELRRLTSNKHEIDNDIEVLKKAEGDMLSSILPYIIELGYNDIYAAIPNIIPVDEYNRLVKIKQNINEALTASRAKYDTLCEQLQNINNQYSKYDETQLREDLERLTKDSQNFKTELDRIKEQLFAQKTIRDELAVLEAQQHDHMTKGEKWLMLDKLIGDAKGNRFNNFAQQLTLQHLLNSANKRIAELNPRYCLEINELNDDDNLYVVDLDMGKQRRSVKTLSGGETFLISLGLALAVADMASHKTVIGSLFIDEGFGSLDPEAFDQAISMLEALQSKGIKNIGIISHVETIKERINSRIEIIPIVGLGYSRLKVTTN